MFQADSRCCKAVLLIVSVACLTLLSVAWNILRTQNVNAPVFKRPFNFPHELTTVNTKFREYKDANIETTYLKQTTLNINSQEYFTEKLESKSKYDHTTRKIIPLQFVNEQMSSKQKYMSLNFQGRLGNLLFQYASLYGIARKQNFLPVVSLSSPLRKYFNISAIGLPKPFQNSRVYNEKRGCAFEKEALNLDRKFNWILNGYFQSWKYFSEYKDIIKSEFAFRPQIQKLALQQFNQILDTQSTGNKENMTYVAVHVRRGDMVSSKSLNKYGYTSADKNYFSRAMAAMKERFPNTLFIVSSDDLTWCRDNLRSENVAFITQKNSPEVDMAILANCHHAIISTGSYGWWLAWLINGTTIYYKNYPRPGSELAKLFVLEDYAPPNRIPM